MRPPFLIAAAIHAALIAIVLAPPSIGIMAISAIGLAAALVIGALAIGRGGSGPGMWTGAAAGLIAIAGWGSWPVLLMWDSGQVGAVINIWGILLPALAVLVYLLAALLAGDRRDR